MSHQGCFSQSSEGLDSAISSLEGNDSLLMDDFELREEPVHICFFVARMRNFKVSRCIICKGGFE